MSVLCAVLAQVLRLENASAMAVPFDFGTDAHGTFVFEPVRGVLGPHAHVQVHVTFRCVLQVLISSSETPIATRFFFDHDTRC